MRVVVGKKDKEYMLLSIIKNDNIINTKVW
jgi:hypothetical protein